MAIESVPQGCEAKTVALARSLMSQSMDHQTRLLFVIKALQERLQDDISNGLAEVAISMIRDNDIEEQLCDAIENLHREVAHV